MNRWWLRDDAPVRVGYDDRTPFGGPMTARPCHSVRAVFAPIFDHVKRNGFGDLLRVAPALLSDVVAGEAFAAITEPAALGTWRVREEVLYPNAELSPPRWLEIGSVRTEVALAAWPAVHDLVARLTHEGCTESDLAPEPAGLLDRLRAAALVLPDPPSGPALDSGQYGLTVLGHNTVLVRSRTTGVLVDPFLFPTNVSYREYQPIGVRQLGGVDLVLITHAHPDHFDPASLLRLPTGVQVVVPVVERETILGANMRHRLRELGFTRVTELGWGETITVGDTTVHALPFYGEQPTDGQVLHPEVRNRGNTYIVETPTVSAAFLADSGRDHLGDVRDVAEAWRMRHPPVDVVFAGYRGWSTYPVQLLFSSVAAFMLFVPATVWTSRHKLMTDAADAVDVAERWGARYLVPYADGGAPWHWEIGLGPRLDGSGDEDPDFDPFPERVIDTALDRVRIPNGPTLPSPVRVALLRPGDSWEDPVGQARITRLPGHAWPFGDPVTEDRVPAP